MPKSCLSFGGLEQSDPWIVSKAEIQKKIPLAESANIWLTLWLRDQANFELSKILH